jgi:hypothetical protein
MFDRLLELARVGKLTDFEPFSERGMAWTDQQLDNAVQAFARMEPFEISEVADFLDKEVEAHFRKHNKASMSLEDAFKGAMMRLPFPACWFEFALPPGSAFSRMAVVAEEDRDSPGGRDYLLSPLTLHTEDGGLTYKLIGGDAGFKVMLDEDGVYSGMEAHSGKLVRVGKEWIRRFNSLCSTAMYAIHLIHWRDVDVQSFVPSKQTLKHAARTGAKPPVSYRTVKIGHWVKKYRSVAQGGGGWEQRWHAVIGHRQTWTESAPQFGCEKCKRYGTGHPPDGKKSHIGTWWIDAGFAGNKELGEIVKTYQIESPVAQLNLPQRKSQSGRKSKSAVAGAGSVSTSDKP